LVLFLPWAQESERILPPRHRHDLVRDLCRQLRRSLGLARSPLAWRPRIRQHPPWLGPAPNLRLRARPHRLLPPMPRQDLLRQPPHPNSRPQDHLW
jgi:hypothetical protein